MSDELIVPLEDKQALLTLVIEARRPREPARAFVVWVNGWLVLVHFACLLSGVLKPHHNDTW